MAKRSSTSLKRARRLNYTLTRKIVRLPEEYIHWPQCGEISGWLMDNDCYKTSEILFKDVHWNDGKWHTGPKMEYYAVDFDDPKDAMKFAIWIGLGID